VPGLTHIKQVVPGESAIIGEARENRSTIYGDHISMVKFSTKDGPGYKKVLNSIETLLEGLCDDLPKQSACRFVQHPLQKLNYPRKVKSESVGLEEVAWSNSQRLYLSHNLLHPATQIVRRETLFGEGSWVVEAVYHESLHPFACSESNTAWYCDNWEARSPEFRP